MRNFREDLLTDKNLVVHCPKKEQAEEFLVWADKQGKKWCDSEGLLLKSYWEDYNETYCINIAEGSQSSKESYESCSYTLLSFEEALLPEEEYTYLETATGDNIPDWWNGKPILVYYSDESEDEAVKDGDKGWLLHIDSNDDYRFCVVKSHKTNDEGTSIKSVFDMFENSWSVYRYVVPVPKNPPTPKVKASLTITRDGEESTIELSEEQLKELGI